MHQVNHVCCETILVTDPAPFPFFAHAAWLTTSCRQLHGYIYPSVKCAVAIRFLKTASWHGSLCDPRASKQYAILWFEFVIAHAHFYPFFRLIFGLVFLFCFPITFFMLGTDWRRSLCGEQGLGVVQENRNRSLQPPLSAQWSTRLLETRNVETGLSEVPFAVHFVLFL